MHRIVLFLSLFHSILLPGAPQGYKGQGRAVGVVTDAERKPLEGVTVKLFSLKGQSGFETVTDAGGEWRATYIRGGGWNLDFEKEGYIPKKIVVELKDYARNPRIEVRLERIEGIVVLEALKEGVDSGNKLFDEGKFEEAAALFEDLATKDPNAYILYKNIGNCYFQLQRYDLAEESYLKVLAKEPDNAEVIMLIGNTYSNRQDPAKALEWYGKIDIERITDPTVLFNIATAFFSQSNFEEALKYSRRAVELKPESTDALHLTGLISLNLGNKEEAICVFEKYLKLDSSSERAAQVRSFLEFLKK